MYKYQPIWNTIKATNKAEVTVSKDYAPTVIQGVKRTKSAENASRIQMGLVGYSPLTIKQEKLSEKMIKITFELLYSTQL